MTETVSETMAETVATHETLHPGLHSQLQGCQLRPEERPPTTGQWKRFLALVNQSYLGMAETLGQLENSVAASRLELHDLNDKLQQESQLCIAATQKSEQKTRFMANMSHELRTPIHGMLGSLEILRETQLDERQRTFIDTAFSSCELMLELVSNILDYSKLRSGQFGLEMVEFSPRELVENVSQIVASQARKKDLEVQCFIPDDIPERVNGDAARIRQMLMNLITNAVKFTERGEVLARIDIIDISDHEVTLRFEVLDTGIGIPEDMQERIFDSFVQVDTSINRRHCGTGLGLAIVKELAGHMASKINVVSTPGEGSRFWFDISLPVMEPHQETYGNNPLDGRYILVVDDNITNQTILKAYLKSWKARPIIASSGMEALQMLRNSITLNEPFAIILLDWFMPNMDGATLARSIRSEHQYDYLPIIMLSSYSLDKSEQQQNGINDSITKPIRAQVLKDLLHQHLLNPGNKNPSPIPTENRLSQPIEPAILLVEDNPVNALIAITMLEESEFRVDHVLDGKEAFKAMCNYPYRLILMDINMPGMDGYSSTRAIREWEQGNQLEPVPIIAMTANALQEDRNRCLEAGMNTHIAKPIRKSDLLNIIQQALDKQPEPSA